MFEQACQTLAPCPRPNEQEQIRGTRAKRAQTLHVYVPDCDSGKMEQKLGDLTECQKSQLALILN